MVPPQFETFFVTSATVSSRAEAQPGETSRESTAGAEGSSLVDVRPVPVSLEDDLAAVAAEHDLDVPPADGLRVSATDWARSGLFHVHRRDRVDLDL